MERKAGAQPFANRIFRGDSAVLFYPALLKLTLHFLTNGQYGYFRDELYYIACGEHLDWGYVDQPPLIAVVAKATRVLFGDSLFAIRFFPAVAGALLVFLTGLIVRQLGGGGFAQLLAALAIIIAPAYLLLHTWLTMNAFEPLFWMACAYIAILILQGRDRRLWLLFGAIAGVGLMNKQSMLFFGFAIVVGLLLTPQRKILFNKWIWFGGALAFIIFLPNIVWQITHGFPTLELLKNVAVAKNYNASTLEFFGGQIVLLHPLNFPLWMAGLYFYLFARDGQQYRALGWAYIVAFATFILLKGKVYYLVPIYPLLIASGAIVIERLTDRYRLIWLRPAIVSLLIVGGAATAPFVLPVLPVETYVEYARLWGMKEGVKTENKRLGVLPQHYADMFGWENMTATVAKVYQSLPPTEQSIAAIYTQNYGEAGAIDFFGKQYNLPKAISGHQNYFLWGSRGYSGEVFIIIGGKPADHRKIFDEVTQQAVVTNEYAMPYENNLPVFVCRKPKFSLTEFWPKAKHYD